MAVVKRFRDLSQIPDLSPDVRQINRRNKEMKCVYRLVLCGWGGENGLGEVQYDIVFPYCNSEHIPFGPLLLSKLTLM